MLCPKCDSTLSPTSVRGTDVDRCSGCQGIWFDEKELEAILQHKRSELRALRGGRPQEEMNRQRGGCPRDGNELTRICSARNPEVVVDACPKCHGIWLDGGELEKLLR
jgi:Zn-finger nucleic acid-binding protein